jgi:type I restriction enzyme R subunit
MRRQRCARCLLCGCQSSNPASSPRWTSAPSGDKNSALKQILDLIVATVCRTSLRLPENRQAQHRPADEFLEDVRQMKSPATSRGAAGEKFTATRDRPAPATMWCRKRSTATTCWRRCGSTQPCHRSWQVIEELIAGQGVPGRAGARSGWASGTTEIAFYDALANNEGAVREL